MGFVQNLRMNNIFPTGGMNLGYDGSLPQYGGSDPLQEILNLYDSRMRNAAPMLSRVASRNAGGVDNGGSEGGGLRFGGVVGQSNPGADILARSAQSADRIWNSYGQPQVTAGEMLAKAGIKPNDQFPGFTQSVKDLDPDTQLKRDLTKSQIKENEARTTEIQNRENVTEDKAWKVITITDPNDPTKQLNARYNTITKKVEPITLPNNGIITTTTKQSDLLKQKEAEAARSEASKAFREKAEAALASLNELSKQRVGADGQGMFDEEGDSVEDMNDKAKIATGYSANIPGLEYMPFGYGTDAASAHGSIDRLKNLLTLDLLQEIKKQSKSGATGFGQMNLRELAVLENSASKLAKMNMNEKDYAKELGRLRVKLNNILAQKEGFTGPMGDVGTEDTKPVNGVGGDFEVLIDPQGIARRIPKDKVAEAMKNGARRQ